MLSSLISAGMSAVPSLNSRSSICLSDNGLTFVGMVIGVETSGVLAAGVSFLRLLVIGVASLVFLVGMQCSLCGTGVVVLLFTQSDRGAPSIALTDVRPTPSAGRFVLLKLSILPMAGMMSSAALPERQSQVRGKGCVTTSCILQCCGSSPGEVSNDVDAM